METIIKFIDNFKSYDSSNVLENTFLGGYCYYFAVILKERFKGDILYDPIEGHFLFYHKNELYDIRGCVTSIYDIHNLYEESEWIDQWSIVKGAILKLDT